MLKARASTPVLLMSGNVVLAGQPTEPPGDLVECRRHQMADKECHTSLQSGVVFAYARKANDLDYAIVESPVPLNFCVKIECAT